MHKTSHQLCATQVMASWAQYSSNDDVWALVQSRHHQRTQISRGNVEEGSIIRNTCLVIQIFLEL